MSISREGRSIDRIVSDEQLRRLSRRGFLVASAATAFLAACGSSNDSGSPATTARGAATTAAAAGGSTATTAAAGGSTGSSAPAGDLKTVKMMWDFLPNLLTAPYFLGIAKGYFSDEGIDLKGQTPPTDLSTKTKLIDSGEVDMSMVDVPQLIFARAQGLKVRSIATTHPLYAAGLIYLPDKFGGTITSPADVKGKTIANFNSPDWQAFLRQFLKTGGMTTSDVTVVDPAFNSVAALTEGKADVADGLFYGERVTLSLLEGQTVGYLDYHKFGVPDMPLFMTVTSEKFIDENADLLAGFNRATAKSLRHYIDPAAEQDRIDAWNTCCTQGATATGTLESITAKYLASNGQVYLPADEDPDQHVWLVQDPAGLQDVLDWSVEIGLADKVEAADAYFTNDYIPEDAQHPKVTI